MANIEPDTNSTREEKGRCGEKKKACAGAGKKENHKREKLEKVHRGCME